MSQSPVGGPSVLIIAEGHSFCMLLEQMLHSVGVAMTTVIDEAEAAQVWLKANTVDAVLVDSDLPSASAVTFAHQLRNDTEQPNRCLPLILMTAKGNPVLMRQAMKAGYDSVMPKPVRRPQLHSELKRVLERPRVYIRSPSGYCGPDRRRRALSDYGEHDRRDGGSFQVFTEDGPVSLETLRALHHASATEADMAVLLVRGADVIARYSLDSRTIASSTRH